LRCVFLVGLGDACGDALIWVLHILNGTVEYGGGGSEREILAVLAGLSFT
jgi:hypothetical protein